EVDEAAARAGLSALALVWNSLGELETLQGDKAESMAAYRRTLELDPDDSFAHAQLADLLESGRHLAAAKMHAEAALRGAPSNFTAALALARVAMRQGRFAEAERAALTAANAPSAAVDNRALAWGVAGEARDRMNDTAGAFKAFTQANLLM